MRLAKACGVTLTHVDTDKTKLDIENAVANQRERPMAPIPGAERLAPTDARLHVVADTGGNTQPKSAAGNAAFQTWTYVQHGEPTTTHVTVSKDHTAATCMGAKDS